MATTFRADTVSGIVTTLRAYSTANPTKLRQVRTARPSSIGETPLAYIGRRPETVGHDQGLRARTMAVQVVFVDVLTDNEESLGRLDPLADAVLDAFTAAPHLANDDAVTQVVSIEDGEDDYGTNVRYETVTMTLQSAIQEGRT